MNNLQAARTNMVIGQITPNVTISPSLYDAMLAVPRHYFVPDKQQGIAYMDKQLSLGQQRYLMSPLLFAQLAQLAHIGPNDTVLDIGCATGYSTAVFSQLAKKVIALEADAELASNANHRLHQLGIENSILISSPLAEGNPEAAPYDVIFINGAIQQVPDSLIAQLADKGRLVTILYRNTDHNPISPTVFGDIVVFRRDKDLISQKRFFPAATFPLVDF